ncbi:hypothetical protein [Paraburkholderia silvatlantica]|uniref:hypothetical protein n=1 Tax=Paraburkholderia silvatlantica TaxID=321895 RepID=UPI0037516D84
MTVQIGQLTEPLGGGVVSRPLENQFTASDRYNLPGLRLSVIKQLGLPAPDTVGQGSDIRASKLIFGSLQAIPTRSPELINVQVSGYSREQAIAALMASFKTFSSPHQQTFDQTLAGMTHDLQATTARLTKAEDDYQHAFQSIQSGNVESGDARNILATNVATQISAQVLNLRQQALALQQATSPLLSYPTRIVEAAYAPVRPSTPSMLLMIVIGAALGFLLGVALAVHRGMQRGQ